MSATRSTFLVDSTPLRNTVRWVTSEQKLHGPSNISLPSVTLPGRDGELALPAARTTGAAEWELSMAVQGNDYADFMANKASLEALLNPSGRVVTITEQQRNAAGTLIRTLSAEAMLTGAEVERPWQSYADGADLRYTFRIPGGVWLEPEVSFNITATGTRTYMEAAGGSAPQQMVRFAALPSASTATITLNPTAQPDAWVSLTGMSGLSTGTTLNFSPQTLAASQGSTNLTMFADCGPVPFHIKPDGRLNVTAFSGFSIFTVYTRKAWY